MIAMSEWVASHGWPWLRDASVQLGFLVAILCVAQPLLGRMPARFRHALWVLVLLKAILPPSLGWTGGIGTWGLSPIWNRFHTADRIEPVPSADPLVSAFPSGTAAAGTAGDSVAGAIASVAVGPEAGGRAVAPIAMESGLFWVWAVGVAAFAALALWRYRRLGRLIGEGERIEEGPLRVEVERLASELGLARSPELVLSSRISSPFLFGLFRGWIVLPAYLPRALAPGEMRHVLLHELMHWKRRDLWTGWVQLVVQALHWFHPLVWLANARLRHERECACDEAVLDHTGGESRSYAESILKVLLESRGRPNMAPGLLGVFERHSRLQQRLETLMDTNRISRRTSRWEWAVLVVFALVVLPMAPVAKSTAPALASSVPSSEGVFAAGAEPGGAMPGGATPGGAMPGASAHVPAAMPEAYVFAFKARAPFAPSSGEELLTAYRRQNPPGVRMHRLQAATVEGVLFGYVVIDGESARGTLHAMFAQSPTLELIEIRRATPETLTLLDLLEKTVAPPPGPPRIVATSPGVGELDVDPALGAITVTFDRDMAGGFSWTGGGPDFPPLPEGQKPAWRTRRTAEFPVALVSGKYYRIGINSTSFQNFRSAEGEPAPPSAIYFVTRGADEATRNRARLPRIVAMHPAHGDDNVDPALTELRVTFDMPMGGGFSWTGGGPQFPSIPEGMRPYWTDDRKTAVLPVRLQPGWNYQLGLNSVSHKNFQSEGGIPLEPVAYSFRTTDAGRP